MPRYRVPLTRTSTEYEWAVVEVEAPTQAEAIEKAVSLGEDGDDETVDDAGYAISWNDHGCGFGGFSIEKTSNEPVELVEESEVEE